MRIYGPRWVSTLALGKSLSLLLLGPNFLALRNAGVWTIYEGPLGVSAPVPVWTRLRPVSLPSSPSRTFFLSRRNRGVWTEETSLEAETGPDGSLERVKRRGHTVRWRSGSAAFGGRSQAPGWGLNAERGDLRVSPCLLVTRLKWRRWASRPLWATRPLSPLVFPISAFTEHLLCARPHPSRTNQGPACYPIAYILPGLYIWG